MPSSASQGVRSLNHDEPQQKDSDDALDQTDRHKREVVNKDQEVERTDINKQVNKIPSITDKPPIADVRHSRLDEETEQYQPDLSDASPKDVISTHQSIPKSTIKKSTPVDEESSPLIKEARQHVEDSNHRAMHRMRETREDSSVEYKSSPLELETKPMLKNDVRSQEIEAANDIEPPIISSRVNARQLKASESNMNTDPLQPSAAHNSPTLLAEMKKP